MGWYSNMDMELARANMIESQVRTWDVLDQKVLDVLAQVKREDFVPPAHRGLAFVDMEIPLGHGETMLCPKLEARLTQELGLSPTDRVLEVGTGSGYQAALLSRLCAHVYTVDVVEEFCEGARRKYAARGIGNVTVETGNAAEGWARHGPYDAILLTGSVGRLADELRRQLAPGGRLVAVVGRAPIMTAQLITCTAPGTYRSEGLFETCIAPLKLVREPERFVF